MSITTQQGDQLRADCQVALITGAAQRIGAVIAKSLHQRGLNVVIHYRNSQQAAHALVSELNAIRVHSAHALAADLCDSEQCTALVQQCVEHAGGLDILVNNASSFYPTPLAAINTEQFDDLLGSNLKGPLFLSSAAADYLQKNNGAIINISDIHARQPLAQHAVYCAAKAGLESLTRSLAQALAPQVRVNAIAPGAIMWPQNTPSQQNQQAIIDATQLKRLGTPEDIASAVCFLALDAHFVTGQILAIDGGRMLVH